MKKLDLHIHTVAVDGKDKFFNFDLQKLKDYVNYLQINGIAITNHNVFDKEQYEAIKTNLPLIKIFPGIEVDLCGGHLLVISDEDDLDDFSIKCSFVTGKVSDKHPYLSVEEFQEIFEDLSKYILIPHYEKHPAVPEMALVSIQKFITAGEVSSPKKFIQLRKKKDKFVPVLFSDSRMSSSMSDFPSRQTYVNIGDITLKTLKEALKDHQKVALDGSDKDLIDIDAGYVKISSGLNVVLGRRSSGKSHTLKLIRNKYGHETVKYIEQFSLTHRDSKNEKNAFDSILAEEKNSLFEEYIALFKEAVEDIISINDEIIDEKEIEDYIETLKRIATNAGLRDVYSRCTLFNDYSFEINSLDGLESLIKAVAQLLNNLEYRHIIDRHVNKESLMNLWNDLVEHYVNLCEERMKKEWANSLMRTIHDKLTFNSSDEHLEEIHFKEIVINKIKRSKFRELCEMIKTPRNIRTLEVAKFKISASTRLYVNRTDAKAILGKKFSLPEYYDGLIDPIRYIQLLKNIGEVNNAEIYKLFFTVEYNVLNQYGLKVSGGEWAEYSLLNAIQDARRFDMLLIDEPESSFDNIFLKDNVNELLKDLAKEMPVVVVTHNNTIGGSISPDFLIVTTQEIIGGQPKFSVYYGYPGDHNLKTRDGNEIENYTIQLDCLEAGKDAYIKRQSTYENLKN